MIYRVSKIFTGYEMLEDHALLIENGIIKKLLHVSEIKNEATITDLGDVLLACCLP
jgi:N-acetylglucosamine-6-phosphate deacetylase